jgi:hypothetical protein
LIARKLRWKQSKSEKQTWDAHQSNLFRTNSLKIGWQLIKQKKADLLVEIARHLDYKIDNIDVDRIYAPRWLVENEQISMADRKLKLAAAEKVMAGGGHNGAEQEPKARCGHKGATLTNPSWAGLQIGWAPFPVDALPEDPVNKP